MIYLTRRQQQEADNAIRWVVQHFENCDPVPVRVSTALFILRRELIREIAKHEEPQP